MRIVDVNSTINYGAVARLIDTDPSVHRPCKEGFTCYHACYVAHRCRFLLPAESICETWGCIMHILFNDMGACDTERYVSRLFLKEAKLAAQGSQRDEDVIFDIANVLVHRLGKQPENQRKSKRGSFHSASSSVHLNGADTLGNTKRWERANLLLLSSFENLVPDKKNTHLTTPSKLNASSAKAIESIFHRDAQQQVVRDGDGNKVMAALDYMKLDKRTKKKDLAVSPRREVLSAWLESSQGVDWDMFRRSFYKHEGDESADDNSDSSFEGDE